MAHLRQITAAPGAAIPYLAMSFLFRSEEMTLCYYMTSQPMAEQVYWHRPIRSVHSADQPHGYGVKPRPLNQSVVDKRVVVDGLGSKAIFDGIGWIIPEQENGKGAKTRTLFNIIGVSVLLRATVDTRSGINTPDILCRCLGPKQ